MTEYVDGWLTDRGAADAEKATQARADTQRLPLHALHGAMDALADVPAATCPACGARAFFNEIYLCGDDHEARAFCRTCGASLLYLRMSARMLMRERGDGRVLNTCTVVDDG